ncbi:putative secreted protein [Pusillimonas sp. T7-7]|uniref:Bug family tripartite tricarboxylate transporter substrate binding protein n=1 Tax=Pusillimonas sp. (strain T7-7) TaxID=1007105 RepID=UPI0002084D03|nr:tripartite tricarboxylate transporter substrate binding protein [Pusillimonas sp. T7-7]AEC21735.1 putative secreted protein [Pusillimonas sp. T7-7]
MSIRTKLAQTALFSLVAISAGVSSAYAADKASDYPKQQPIKLIVGYPAGGSTDLNGRLLGKALAERLGQTVVVENLGGAGGAIAAQKVVNEPGDGYSLLVGAVNEVVIAQLVNPSVKYDGLKDFTAIGLIGSQPLLLAASKQSKIGGMDDYIAMTKQGDSASFNFGSSGVGTALHLTGEMINTATQAHVQHIPYRGVSPLVTDMLSGQLDFGVFGLSSGLPHVQAGAISAIGITSDERSAIAPDIPALSENSTFKDLNVSLWFGLFGPANMPEAVVAKLKSALNDVVHDQAFQEEYKRTGGTVISDPVDMNDFLKQEQAKYQQAVQQANIGR